LLPQYDRKGRSQGAVEVFHAVLLGQLFGGVVGGHTRARLGNISLDFRRDENIEKGWIDGLGYRYNNLSTKEA